MDNFRVKISFGDFTVSTVEKANDKNEAIHRVFCHQKIDIINEDGIKITCEKIPQKSAFQEWNDSKKNDFIGSTNIRKEGWNAAIDAVLSKKCTIMNDEKTEIFLNVVDVSEIEKLKES